jgi:hypothetical protein
VHTSRATNCRDKGQLPPPACCEETKDRTMPCSTAQQTRGKVELSSTQGGYELKWWDVAWGAWYN